MVRPTRPDDGVAPKQKALIRPSDNSRRGTEVTADEVFSKVLRLVRTVQAGLKNIESSHGVSGAQLWVLWHLSAKPGQRVKELAEALHIHPSTASNLLDKLEARDLVRRERRDSDSRVVRLYLAEAGLSVVKGIPGPMQGELRHAIQQVPMPILAGLLVGVTTLLQLMDLPPPKGSK